MSETKASSMINKEFLKVALQNYGKGSNLEILNFALSHATAKGDNFASEMYRVKVDLSKDGKKETKSFIVKIHPIEEGGMKALVEQMDGFATEIKMMTNILVKMNESLKGLKKDVLSAEVFYSRQEFPSLLVLEDLKSSGFQVANRQTGLDLAHCVLTIRNLAHFHASSMHLIEKENLDTSAFKFKILYGSHYKQYSEAGMKALSEEIRNWPEVDPSYSAKIAKCADNNLFVKCRLLIDNNDKEFKVICHGDCWVNNIMYRYDEAGKPIQQIFVDFQMCVYASPALDLLFFFSTSLMEDIYQNKRDYLLNVYLETLTSTMNTLGCKTKAPTMHELKESLIKNAAFELFVTFVEKPVLISEKDVAQDMNEMFESEQTFNVATLKGSTFRKILVSRLPDFERLGLFE